MQLQSQSFLKDFTYFWIIRALKKEGQDPCQGTAVIWVVKTFLKGTIFAILGFPIDLQIPWRLYVKGLFISSQSFNQKLFDVRMY